MGWFSPKNDSPLALLGTEIVATGDRADFAPYPVEAWLLRLASQWLVVSLWRQSRPGSSLAPYDARWYLRAPRGWVEAGRMPLGERVKMVPPIEGPEGPTLCWEDASTDQITASSWDSARSGFTAPVVVHEGQTTSLTQMLLPDGAHAILVTASGIDERGMFQRYIPCIFRRPRGSAGYDREAVTAETFNRTAYVPGHGSCLSSGLVLSAHSDYYSGPDDEVDTTVFVRTSADFGESWSEPVALSRRSGSSPLIHALPSGGALLAYEEAYTGERGAYGGQYGIAPWRQTIWHSRAGTTWTRLPQTPSPRQLSPLVGFVESRRWLCVFSFAEIGCWHDGQPVGVFAAPVPRGWSGPSVEAARLEGGTVHVLHQTVGDRRDGTPGAIAVSELALPD